MDNQHRQIKGYRDLTQADLDAMNAVKAQEAVINGMVDYLKALPGVDGRQVALAATHFEEAFMHAVRAIAQPERIVASFAPQPQPAALEPGNNADQVTTISAGDAAGEIYAGQANGAGVTAGGNVELDPVTGQPKPKASEQV